MKKIQLISTKNDQAIDSSEKVYLGNWCDEDNYIINKKNVVSYHWNNREKLEKDNDYINELYEKILNNLSLKLNQIHEENNDVQYWRTILGYWLFYYLSVNMDRWENVKLAFNQFKNINLFNLLNIENYPIPYNTREFMNLISDSKWNHFNYSKIINFYSLKEKKNINFVEKKIKEFQFYFNYKADLKHKTKLLLLNIYNFIFSKLIKKNKIIIYKTYFGLFNECILNMRFKQLPIFFLNSNIKKKVDYNLREKLKLNCTKFSSFEEFVIDDIFNNIPSEFLENYKDINNEIKNKSYPINSKIIFSTRSLATDNIFVRYLAKEKMKGCTVLYGQHGGAYGHIKYSWAEDHEIKISDHYLSWGWDTKNNKKVIPFYILKNIEGYKFERKKKIKKICYFLRSRPKFTGRIDASTGSNQMAQYYSESLEFFKLFKKKFANMEIYPRLHEAKFEWNHINIWKKYCKNKFSFTNQESLKNVYKNYDLIIYSYIGTGFLESLALNKPFILISSLRNWPLREDCKNDFVDLEKAKIFFQDENDALEHLENIKKMNIYDWWENEETKIIKKKFMKKYANIDKHNKINNIYNLIKNILLNEK